jgi:hypothetical protein
LAYSKEKGNHQKLSQEALMAGVPHKDLKTTVKDAQRTEGKCGEHQNKNPQRNSGSEKYNGELENQTREITKSERQKEKRTEKKNVLRE